MCFQLSFEDCHTPSCPNIIWELIPYFGAQALNNLYHMNLIGSFRTNMCLNEINYEKYI